MKFIKNPDGRTQCAPTATGVNSQKLLMNCYDNLLLVYGDSIYLLDFLQLKNT
jgi:hypothetical protein